MLVILLVVTFMGMGQLSAVSSEKLDGGSEEAIEQVDDQHPVDLEELRRSIEVLAEEIENLRSGEVQQIKLSEEDVRSLGLAPSAASAYMRDTGISFAGYGEMIYKNYSGLDESRNGTGEGTQFDFLRNILYAGYRFNDKFLFNSEIEVEHAKEIFVEFAYIDYLANENIGFRGGLLLVPVGMVNEFHEPTVFLGADRPVTEQRIIPTTWRENGAGVYGSVNNVAYRAYIINGFNGSKFSSEGLRGGRQKGSKAKAGNMAFAGRVDVTPMPGVLVGASLYSGGSGHGDIKNNGRDFNVQTSIFDLHGQAQIRGFDLRGLYARASIGDALELNQALGLTGTNGVAETMHGGYVQVSYNLLSQIRSFGFSLAPYIRYEKVDTQSTMPAGFARSLSTNATFRTLGVELKPIQNIVLKVDYTWVSNQAHSGVSQFNINMGYAF